MYALVELSESTVLCARCKEPVTTRAMRSFDTPLRHYHLDCAIDVDAQFVDWALASETREFEGRAAIASLAEARLAAKADANRLKKKHKNLPPVEPAKDRKGRPRVRVLCLHSSDGSSRSPGPDYFDTRAFGADQTIASSIREYVFVTHKGPSDLRVDPAQPWVAAAYWQDASATVSPGNPKLVEWRALGLPSPVLVIVGRSASDESRCDAVALKLRALVEKSGFNPDECPVIGGAADDEAFRDRLLLALDAQASAATKASTERNNERVGDTLDSLIDEGRVEAIALAITSAAKTYRSSRASEKERTLAAIERALVAHPALSAKVLVVLRRSGVALARERLTVIIAAMIALPKLPARVEEWLRWWRDSEGETDGLGAAVRAVIDEDEASEKAAQLRALMARVGLSLNG